MIDIWHAAGIPTGALRTKQKEYIISLFLS